VTLPGVYLSEVILIQQQKWGPGELARRIIRLLATVSSQSMRNRMEFLSGWGSDR
jgi:hypothetical protein